MKLQSYGKNVKFSGNSTCEQKKLDIFYFSDYHSNIPAYKKLVTASDEFDKRHIDKEADALKLCGGDLFIGSDKNKRACTSRLVNKLNIDAAAVGNHELDNGRDFLKELDADNSDKVNFPFLSTNVILNENRKKVFASSKIIEKDGNKYGIIGITTNDIYNDVNIFSTDKTLETKKQVENAVQKLKETNPDINKIILLSHLGYSKDCKIAKSVSDIDIIVGGHSHTLVEGLDTGKNLIYSPKNEPVIIVQAGYDNLTNKEFFGELSIEFNNNGVIQTDSALNNVKDVSRFAENPNAQKIAEYYADKEVIGKMDYDCIPSESLRKENPIADLVADAIYKEASNYGAKFVLLNSGSIREGLPKGDIDREHLKTIMPHPSNIVVVKYSEKEIIDALNWGIKSLDFDKVSPGLFQVSGLHYAISKNGKAKDVYYTSKEGEKIYLDSQHPSEDKRIPVATRKFLLSGPAGLSMLVKDESEIIEECKNELDLTVKYISSEFSQNPIRLNTDKNGEILNKRIETENKPSFAGKQYYSMAKHYSSLAVSVPF